LVRAAESRVKEWREQQALYLPEFPADTIGELRSSLDYPPPRFSLIEYMIKEGLVAGVSLC